MDLIEYCLVYTSGVLLDFLHMNGSHEPICLPPVKSRERKYFAKFLSRRQATGSFKDNNVSVRHNAPRSKGIGGQSVGGGYLT